MARKQGKRGGLTSQELKAFRSQVAKLKSKGLVSKRVDARSQKPTRYMRSKVKSLAGVFSGDLAAVKVKPDLLTRYREAGFPVIGGRVVIEKTRGETAGIKRGMPLIRKPLGAHQQERLVLPYSPRNFNALVAAVENDPDRFNNLKEPDETFAFTFFGNWSLAHFDDIELMLDYLLSYQALDPDPRNEAWRGLNLYRITGRPPATVQRRGASGGSKRKRQRGKLMGPENFRKQEAARIAKLRQDEAFRIKERERDKHYQAARRASLKAAPDRGKKGGKR